MGVNKWWRNVSPNIAAEPFCDQLAARQKEFLIVLCFVLFP